MNKEKVYAVQFDLKLMNSKEVLDKLVVNLGTERRINGRTFIAEKPHLVVSDGDYIIKTLEGDVTVVSNAQFNIFYEAIEANPKKTINQTIENNFTYHPPKEGQAEKYEMLRDSARNLANIFDSCAPDSREKSLALTKLEEAVFWINASIARNE